MKIYNGEQHENMKKRDFMDCDPIAYDATAFHNPAEIIDIIHDIDDMIVVKYDGKIHIVKTVSDYDGNDSIFFIGREKFKMSNFMRTTYPDMNMADRK